MDAREPSRIREEGRKVFNQQDGAGVIAACRQIIADHSFAKINGLMVDAFSASAIIAVHDAIGGAQRDRFLAMPVEQMASLSFKVIERAGRK